MKHIFIVNPVAGGKDVTEEIKAEASRILGREGYLLLRTEYVGHAEALARSACEETTEPIRLYSCGGDGTLNEVLCGIKGFSHAELAVYPSGTGNDFVRAFETNQTAFLDVERLIRGTSIRMDMLNVSGRPCLNIASVGLDSAVAENVHRYSGIPFLRKKAYQISLVRCFFTSMKNHYRLTIDGETRAEEDYTLAVAANGRCYGGGFCAAPEAQLNDGEMDLIFVRATTRKTFLSLVGPYQKGKHLRQGKSLYPDVIEFKKAKELRIEAADALPVNVDGEIIRMKDPVIQVLEKRLRFVLPAALSPVDCLEPEEKMLHMSQNGKQFEQKTACQAFDF